MLALRRHPCFRHSRVIVVPEANLGNEAQEISDTMIREPGVTILCSVKDGYGIRTDRGMPNKYILRFTSKLAEDAVSYHDQIVCGNPFLSNVPEKDKAERAKKELERQLKAFRRVLHIPLSLRSPVSVSFTGLADKDGNRSGRLRDDLVMALLFGVYYSGEHMVGRAVERGYTERFELDASAVVESAEKRTH